MVHIEFLCEIWIYSVAFRKMAVDISGKTHDLQRDVFGILHLIYMPFF